ncbi:hypothetical protein FACS189418_0570 [Clostridia bacterium]|nr:hypothetical protein FACS189418_0570 [Clostridia bacterium]
MESPKHEDLTLEETKVTLTLEDDSELDCIVIDHFAAGSHEYVAVVPEDELDNEEAEVYLYRYVTTEKGEPNLENIQDDEEYEIASDVYEERLDTETFHEWDDEHDEE